MSLHRSFPKGYSHIGGAVLLIVMYIVVCDFSRTFVYGRVLSLTGMH